MIPESTPASSRIKWATPTSRSTKIASAKQETERFQAKTAVMMKLESQKSSSTIRTSKWVRRSINNIWRSSRHRFLIHIWILTMRICWMRLVKRMNTLIRPAYMPQSIRIRRILLRETVRLSNRPMINRNTMSIRSKRNLTRPIRCSVITKEELNALLIRPLARSINKRTRCLGWRRTSQSDLWWAITLKHLPLFKWTPSTTKPF